MYRIVEKKIYIGFDGKSYIEMDKTYHSPIKEKELEKKLNRIRKDRIKKGWNLLEGRLRMHDMEIYLLVE